jgi:ABC-type multidrug transport system fused ATPase/permease subunit
LPKAFYDEHQTGYLTRRITEDVDGLRILFSGFAFNAAGQAVRLLGGACFLLYLEWRIALVVLALLPGLAWGLRYVSGKIYLLSRRRLEYQAEAAGMIQESLAGASTRESVRSRDPHAGADHDPRGQTARGEPGAIPGRLPVGGV